MALSPPLIIIPATETKYVDIWIRVENLVLPAYLQKNGLRSTATAELCVKTTHSKLQTTSLSKAGETQGVDVIGHGPLGHSIIWRDSLRIVKENSDQSLHFAVYIDNKKVAELGRVVLSALLDANDGAKTTQLFLPNANLPNANRQRKGPVGANARARLIVEARVGTSTPFSAPGLKPGITVLNCPTDELRIRVKSGTYALRPAQVKAVQDFRKSKHSKYIKYKLASGKMFYIARNLEQFEIFYNAPKMNKQLANTMGVLKFLFLLKKKRRNFPLAALRFPSIGLTTPRFDEVATTLWDNASGPLLKSNNAATPDSQKQHRKAVEKHFAATRRSLISSKKRPTSLSVQFIPDLSLLAPELDGLPNAYGANHVKQLKQQLKMFNEFIVHWQKTEGRELKQFLKDYSGESRPRSLKNRLIVTPVASLESTDEMREKLFSKLKDNTQRASYTALQKAIDEALEVLPYDDDLLRIARKVRLDRWEHANYNKALILLTQVSSTLLEMRECKISMDKPLSHTELRAHAVFHSIYTKVACCWYLLKLAERIIRYDRLGVVNVTTDKRIATLRNLRKIFKMLQLGKPAHWTDNESSKLFTLFDSSGNPALCPLDIYRIAVQARAKSGGEEASAQDIQELANIEKAMSEANKWQKAATSGAEFLSFCRRSIYTTTQMMKLLKWADRTAQRPKAGALSSSSAVPSPANARGRSFTLSNFESRVGSLVHKCSTYELKSAAKDVVSPVDKPVHWRSFSLALPPCLVDAEAELDFGNQDDAGDPTLKTMTGDYELEAITPLNLNKNVMMMMHKMWDLHFRGVTSLETFICCAVPHHSGVMRRMQGAAANYKAFANLQKIYHAARRKFGDRLFSTIRYLKHPPSREKYRLLCTKGILTDFMGKPFDTEQHYSNHSGNGFAIIVFHKKLGLYAGNHVPNRFHHSSFLAGDAVHFAGEMRVEKGRVATITSKSGHYKPNTRHGFTFLRWLRGQGLDLSTVEYREVKANNVLISMNAAELIDGHLAAEAALESVLNAFEEKLKHSSTNQKCENGAPASSDAQPAANTQRQLNRIPKLSERYLVDVNQLQETLRFAKMSLTKFLSSTKGQVLMTRLAAANHKDDKNEAVVHMLTEVWHEVVRRSQIADLSESQKITMRTMIESNYATVSQSRRHAAAASASKAAKSCTDTNVDTIQDTGAQVVDGAAEAAVCAKSCTDTNVDTIQDTGVQPVKAPHR